MPIYIEPVKFNDVDLYVDANTGLSAISLKSLAKIRQERYLVTLGLVHRYYELTGTKAPFFSTVNEPLVSMTTVYKLTKWLA